MEEIIKKNILNSLELMEWFQMAVSYFMSSFLYNHKCKPEKCMGLDPDHSSRGDWASKLGNGSIRRSLLDDL